MTISVMKTPQKALVELQAERERIFKHIVAIQKVSIRNAPVSVSRGPINTRGTGWGPWREKGR